MFRVHAAHVFMHATTDGQRTDVSTSSFRLGEGGRVDAWLLILEQSERTYPTDSHHGSDKK